MIIHPYSHSQDARGVFALWQAALGDEWPITRQLFLNVVHSTNYWENCHLVAREGEEIVGFVAAQVQQTVHPQPTEANISALFVAPNRQGRGVGRALHEKVTQRLRDAGAQKVQLGGGLYRFWPGVPANLYSAVPFFLTQGWEFTDVSHDLIQDLSQYNTPTGIYQPLLDSEISLHTATEVDVPQVLAFLQAEFPSWLTAYQDVIARGDYSDILIARDRDGITGLLIMYSPQSHPARADVVWRALLGSDVGALGTVGVAEAARGQGIGLALVARGSEILRDRGVTCCHISWVVLLEFYGKLGFRPWRSYKMSWRSLDARLSPGK